MLMRHVDLFLRGLADQKLGRDFPILVNEFAVRQVEAKRPGREGSAVLFVEVLIYPGKNATIFRYRRR